MSEAISPRSALSRVARAEGPTELPPLSDPYLRGPRPPQKKPLSTLALTSILAPFVGGPLGSVAAIVFGWAARREHAGVGAERRGYVLATLGMGLGICLTVAWGAAIAFGVWTMERSHEAQLASIANVVTVGDTASPPEGAVDTTDPASPPSKAVPVFQKETMVRKEGTVTVVDVGVSVSSLSQELAKERAAAAAAGETIVVMTTKNECVSCRSLSSSLGNPLMQTALAHVRLVRVDIDAFDEDLTGLKMPHERVPGFFLLAPDLYPRDAIDGGEWDEDVPANMAPVLGAFVRGKYETRRQSFEPIQNGGIKL
ncbi:DUF4190 domain-containing protein [Polyangium jinanense]|uniref:DUF4190 domain-containing protein n=1 Tax=Polyangium jinanense TaxID=2829994 RepID=A0A9X3X482_9BACT|nr:DUF4190 domain-containing protein [Polyangium jinanense]MDC3959125.1 DUF4190 domain-containing protein [Polyangium jinanense]MDC3983952.1 DUF4190 domain-containing protein [Polyangium jinanense]